MTKKQNDLGDVENTGWGRRGEGHVFFAKISRFVIFLQKKKNSKPKAKKRQKPEDKIWKIRKLHIENKIYAKKEDW